MGIKSNRFAENWVNVPTNSILTIHRQTVMVHPIVDKYYSKSPSHVRSSAFVQTKGLVSNEKVAARMPSPEVPLIVEPDDKGICPVRRAK